MSAESFTRGWVRTYTRGLPEATRAMRLDEIDSDLHEHRTTGAHGAAIVGRTLRGVPADVSWRREERRAVEATNGRLTGVRALWATATQAWFTPLAVVLGLFNVLLAFWVLTDDDGKMPGQVIGPVIVLGLTAALFVGLRLRWRSGQAAITAEAPATKLASATSTARVRMALGFGATLSVVAVVLGLMGSLVLLAVGVLALVGVAAVAARGRSGPAQSRVPKRSIGAEHVMLADVLIIIGTLPALGLFWMVFPAILALLVIGGVIGTGPGTRRRAAYSG